jgi:hypothetical protein
MNGQRAPRGAPHRLHARPGRAASRRLAVRPSCSSTSTAAAEAEIKPGVYEGCAAVPFRPARPRPPQLLAQLRRHRPSPATGRYWTWQGHRIRYQRSGNEGQAVLLVHGFGGNWWAPCRCGRSPPRLHVPRPAPHPHPDPPAPHP